MTFDSQDFAVQTNFRNSKSGDTNACFTQFQTSFTKTALSKKLGRFFKAPLMYRFSKDHEDQRHKKTLKTWGLT